MASSSFLITLFYKNYTSYYTLTKQSLNPQRLSNQCDLRVSYLYLLLNCWCFSLCTKLKEKKITSCKTSFERITTKKKEKKNIISVSFLSKWKSQAQRFDWMSPIQRFQTMACWARPFEGIISSRYSLWRSVVVDMRYTELMCCLVNIGSWPCRTEITEIYVKKSNERWIFVCFFIKPGIQLDNNREQVWAKISQN